MIRKSPQPGRIRPADGSSDKKIKLHEELGNVSAIASFSVVPKMRAARSARRTDWSALDDQPFLVFFCFTIASQGVRRP
jgi:hypothetical protein